MSNKENIDCGFYSISGPFVFSEDTAVPRATALLVQKYRADLAFRDAPVMHARGEGDDGIASQEDKLDMQAQYTSMTVHVFGEAASGINSPHKFSNGFSVEVFPGGHWDVKVAPTIDRETQRIIDLEVLNMPDEERHDFFENLQSVWPLGKIGEDDEIEFSNEELILGFLDDEFSSDLIFINDDGEVEEREIDLELEVLETEDAIRGEITVPFSSILPMDSGLDAQYEVKMGLIIKGKMDDREEDAYTQISKLIKNKLKGKEELDKTGTAKKRDVITESAIKKNVEPYIKIRRREEVMV